jgi:hypothetical protein
MFVDGAAAWARLSTGADLTPLAWAWGLDSFMSFLDEFLGAV